MTDDPQVPATGPATAVNLPGPETPNIIQRMHPALFAGLSLAGIFILYQVIGGGMVLLLSGGKITVGNVALVRWATLIGQLLFILAPTLLLARLRTRRLSEFFRFRVPDYRHVIAAIVAVFALQQVLVGYMALQDLIPLPDQIRKFLDLVKTLYEETYRILLAANSPLELAGVVVVVALAPAFSEELLFRGLVQRSIEEVAGGLRGAVLTGIVFGMYHLIPTSLVPLAVLGIFLGVLVVRTGNITVAMSAHFFNNAVACAACYMHLDDDFVALAPSGGATGASVAMNSALFGLVFLASVSYLWHSTRSRNET